METSSSSSNIDESTLPMPPGWMRRMVNPPNDNRIGYFNIKKNELHYQHPLVKEARESVELNHSLPAGWEKYVGTLKSGRTQSYYSCKSKGISIWDHPCLRAELDMILLREKERRVVGQGQGSTHISYAKVGNSFANSAMKSGRLSRDMCCVNLMNHRALQARLITPTFGGGPTGN